MYRKCRKKEQEKGSERKPLITRRAIERKQADSAYSNRENSKEGNPQGKVGQQVPKSVLWSAFGSCVPIETKLTFPLLQQIIPL
ncbi:MAG TPA: hypothetical protein DCG32_00670 [Sphaerochaeta sp.]|nr:hypothetical protein [Sphaerochaeta sp.]